MADPLEPVIDLDNERFWADCRRGVLSVQRCADCGRFRYPPRLVCPGCLSERVEWVAASGRGHVYSCVTVHHAFRPELREDLPYNLSLIELAEGPRMWSRVVGCPPGDVGIGLPVRVVFQRRGDAVLPYFEPETAAPARHEATPPA